MASRPLPQGRFRLRRTYEGKAAPNRLDEIGRWKRAADSPRVELYVAGSRRGQFLLEADGSLRKLDTSGRPIASGLNDRLQRLPHAELIDPRLELSGLLQAAYMKAQPPLGKALPVSVEGRITTRPSMEESLPPQDTLVVERFISLSRRRTCGPIPPDARRAEAAPRSLAHRPVDLAFHPVHTLGRIAF